MKPDIIALGEPLLELNAVNEHALDKAGTFTTGFGGDTSNFAVAAARAGGKVGYLTRLGADPFGDAFLDLWKRDGIDASCVERDKGTYTGMYFVTRKGGKHEFTYYRSDSAASRMTVEFLPKEYIGGARLLHVSGITLGISASACDTAFAAMALARQAGLRISFDPNLRLALWPLSRARAVIREATSQADLVFPSYEDAQLLTGFDAPEDIVRVYLDMGPKLVVLKLGENGAILARNGEITRYPAFKVDAIDCSGAGDAFSGTFAANHLAGKPLEECMRRALAAGALTTTGLGCVTPIPSAARVDEFLNKQAAG